MNIYFAPLEGITGYVYRNAHHRVFGGADRYYTPFLSPNYTHRLKGKEAGDVDPANNEGIPLVPQILTNRAEDFLWAAGELADRGYREVNLNLGCPMPTVVKKRRGAGQLADLDALDLFFEKICSGMEQDRDPDRDGKRSWKLSVKTRIGMDTAEKAEALVGIYNRYPISELIVHPRTQKDLYRGEPDLETFAMILDRSVHPVVYNGDICTVSDYQRITARFPACRGVMIGRGLIANPALAREIRTGEPLRIEELRLFHDEVFKALQEWLPGQAPLIGKMKELWFYMGNNFRDADRSLKEIRKAKNIVSYQAAVRTLFAQGRFAEKQ
ncbi:MAG: tRNA-dihydrouridine synthase family protein [Eubacteriales bacterium]|nr:tRNA-dihydrouridine synthase family protein [Eubacteriales bacterium]